MVFLVSFEVLNNIQGQRCEHIFAPSAAIVLIMLQIFFETRTVLKTREYLLDFPSFSLRLFSHMTHLQQSPANENII